MTLQVAPGLCRGIPAAIKTKSPGLTLCFLGFLPSPTASLFLPQLFLVPQGWRSQQVPVSAGPVRCVRARTPAAVRAAGFPCTHRSVVSLGSVGSCLYTTLGKPFLKCGAHKGEEGQRLRASVRAHPHHKKGWERARSPCAAHVLSTPKLRREVARILALPSYVLETLVRRPRPASWRERLVKVARWCCALSGCGAASLPTRLPPGALLSPWKTLIAGGWLPSFPLSRELSLSCSAGCPANRSS